MRKVLILLLMFSAIIILIVTAYLYTCKYFNDAGEGLKELVEYKDSMVDEKIFLSDYKDIVKFVLIEEYGGFMEIVVFGDYDKSSSLLPTKFSLMDDCYFFEEYKLYENELKCKNSETVVCKIIMNKPNIFIEKCQYCDYNDNSTFIVKNEYSVSGDVLTVKSTTEFDIDKVVISEALYKRNDTIKSCTEKEIIEWKNKNVIPISTS